ncbi:MAG: patatin-like phospholipase family protein [Prevotella sp.]|nr:patatin-like phospholipase family protein [Prevotella sp.]
MVGSRKILAKIFKSERRDVALVLSSGGARGMAHIGAIDSLMAHGFNITSVAGTSFGSIVAGMYAMGHLDDFKEWMAGIDKKAIRRYTDYSLSLSYFVKGERIIDELKKIAPDRDIEDLPIPFACVSTDWKTGREIVFDKGSIWQAIRASISVPGMFAPVELNNHILIDGGITNPLPLDRVVRKSDDLLVGVNVSGHDYGSIWERRHAARLRQIRNSKALQFLNRLVPGVAGADMNFFTLLDQTFSISISQNARRAILLNHPDILVDIPMRRFGGGDYDKYAQIHAVGSQKTDKAIEAFLKKSILQYDKPAWLKKLTV